MDRSSVAGLDGVLLSVLSAGLTGPRTPVLLIHGLASNAHLWDGVADALAGGGHPVVAVDQRGHGHSAKPDSSYDFETLTTDLVHVIDHFGWRSRRPVVAGQSWGGNVVLELTIRHPTAARAVALVDGGTIELADQFADWPTCEAALAPPPLAGMTSRRFERRIRTQHPDWPDAAILATLANVEVLADGTIRPWLGRDRHLTILRSLWEHHPSERYGLVSVPVLMLMAEDPADPRWMSAKRYEVARAQQLLPRSELNWIPGDHDLHAEQPELIARHLQRLTLPPEP